MQKIEQLEILEDVHEALTETLKQAANEPSVGLYFVQQHVHKAVPALLTLKAQLLDTTMDAELATADAKDALSSIKAMKECGPPVIEHMIKTLKSASNMIPALRQSRGSTPQLLPRPVRPAGVSRGPLRSASYIADWNSDMSISKRLPPSGKVSKDSASVAVNEHQIAPAHPSYTVKCPGETSTFIVPHGQDDGELETERKLTAVQQDLSISAGHDNADKVSDGYMKSVLKTAMLKAGWPGNTSTDSPDLAHESKDADVALSRISSIGAVKDVSGGSPARYMRAVLDSALSKAETVSRESAKFLRGDAENQTSDGKVAEKKNWIPLPAQGLLGFGKKTQKIMPESEEGEMIPVEGGTSSEHLNDLEDNYEQFQAERVAKLEAWLSESDGDSGSKT